MRQIQINYISVILYLFEFIINEQKNALQDFARRKIQ